MNDVSSRLTARMQAREAQRSTAQSVTEADLKNLDEYAEKLDEATALLRDEVTALGQGHLETIADLYAKKAELLKWLELRAPLVEPFLKLDVASKRQLPIRLQAFKEMLEQDGKLLKHMGQVAVSISREIEKIFNRNSLDGLYGQSGEKLSAFSDQKKALDQKI